MDPQTKKGGRLARLFMCLFAPFINLFKLFLVRKSQVYSELPSTAVDSTPSVKSPSKFRKFLAIFKRTAEYEPLSTSDFDDVKVIKNNLGEKSNDEKIVAGVTEQLLDDDDMSCTTEEPTSSLAAVVIAAPSDPDDEDEDQQSNEFFVNFDGSRRESKVSASGSGRSETRRSSIITEPLWFLGRRSSKSARDTQWLNNDLLKIQDAQVLSHSQILSEIQKTSDLSSSASGDKPAAIFAGKDTTVDVQDLIDFDGGRNVVVQASAL